MNAMDAAITLALLVAVITSFNSGLLRSAVNILAYLIALPIAYWATALVAPASSQAASPLPQEPLLFFAAYLVAGIGLGKLMRLALDEAIGPGAGLGDRLAGAALGAVRVGLVAVTLVLVFDQLVPPERQPAYFTGSQLRPLLLLAGQRGFRSLPSDLVAAIDRFKRDRHI